MSFSIYKIDSTSGSIQGHIEVTYRNTFLHKVQFNIAMELTGQQFEWLMSRIPQMESEFNELFGKVPTLNLTKLEDRELTTPEKIAWFCSMYSAHKGGLKYKVSARDSGMVKHISFTSGLLEFYFKSQHWMIKDRQSIPHLVRNYNEVRALMFGKTVRPKPDFPDYYDPNYEQKLDAERLIQYRKHLRFLGWTPVKHRITNAIIDWKEPAPAPQGG